MHSSSVLHQGPAHSRCAQAHGPCKLGMQGAHVCMCAREWCGGAQCCVVFVWSELAVCRCHFTWGVVWFGASTWDRVCAFSVVGVYVPRGCSGLLWGSVLGWVWSELDGWGQCFGVV